MLWLYHENSTYLIVSKNEYAATTIINVSTLELTLWFLMHNIYRDKDLSGKSYSE